MFYISFIFVLFVFFILGFFIVLHFLYILLYFPNFYFFTNSKILSGTRVAKSRITTMEGTVGSEQWLSIDTSSIDEHLPTVEIYKQRFNGILFEELPIVYIKVSRNNTIIEGRDYKVSYFAAIFLKNLTFYTRTVRR